MRDHHNRQATVFLQETQDRTDIKLMLQIEERRRLIKQQHLWCLSERPSNHGPLTLSSGEIHDGTFGEMRHIHCGHRLLSNGTVLPTIPTKSIIPAGAAPVRESPHQHRFSHTEGKCRLVVLWNKCHLPRHLNLGGSVKGLAEQRNLSLLGPQDFRKKLQQRCLPRSVGTDYAKNLPGVNVNVHIAQCPGTCFAQTSISEE